MRGWVLWCVCMAALGGPATGGLFDPVPESPRPAPPERHPERAAEAPAQGEDSAGAELGFVLDGSKETILASIVDTLKAIDDAMAAAAAEGNTARHGQLKAKRAQIAQLEERAKADVVLPSIYPLEVGKKGCLHAIRETPLSIEVGDGQPVAGRLQVVSWFQVKVTGERDEAYEADIYDAAGKLRLYRTVIHGMNGALKPGAAVRLTNMPFLCTMEEAGEGGDEPTVYHLKRLDVKTFVEELNGR